MMPSIGGFSISVTANTAALNTGFKKASKLTNGLRGSIGKLGMGIAAIGAPVSLIAGLTAVVRIGADFEKQMSNVKSAVNASGDQLQRLSDLAEELGASTAFSAGEAAAAMTEMAKAGLDAQEIYRAAPAVLTLAAAGELEMAEAAKIATTAMNLFSLPASDMAQITDKLVKSTQSGAIGVSGMGTQLAYAGSSAVGFGMDISETTGILAKLAGELTEEKAGTGFRAMMNSIRSPTAVAAEEMERLKIKVTDANDEFLPFAQVIGNFNNALNGMPTGERTRALGKMFTTIGDPAISKMLKIGADGIREINAEMAASDGYGMQVAADKLDNVTGAFIQVKSAASGLAIDFEQLFEDELKTSLLWLVDFISKDLYNAMNGFKQLIHGTAAAIAELENAPLTALKRVAAGLHEVLYPTKFQTGDATMATETIEHITELNDSAGFNKLGNAVTEAVKPAINVARDLATRQPMIAGGAIAMKGSEEAFDVINRAIKGEQGYDKTIAKEAEKQTKLLQDQVSLLENISGTGSSEVFSFA
jgi:TP901 family phage tail tape measure protein